MASVSFSNLSAEIPQIEIIRDCTASIIDPRFIEQKKPRDLASQHLRIPAGKPVGFRYTYFWLLQDRTDVISRQSGLIPSIETKTSRNAHRCTRRITFKPQANRYYEIYFGISAGECRIGVSEAYYEKGSVRKKLAPVEKSTDDSCRQQPSIK